MPKRSSGAFKFVLGKEGSRIPGENLVQEGIGNPGTVIGRQFADLFDSLDPSDRGEWKPRWKEIWDEHYVYEPALVDESSGQSEAEEQSDEETIPISPPKSPHEPPVAPPSKTYAQRLIPIFPSAHPASPVPSPAATPSGPKTAPYYPEFDYVPTELDLEMEAALLQSKNTPSAAAQACLDSENNHPNFDPLISGLGTSLDAAESSDEEDEESRSVGFSGNHGENWNSLLGGGEFGNELEDIDARFEEPFDDYGFDGFVADDWFVQSPPHASSPPPTAPESAIHPIKANVVSSLPGSLQASPIPPPHVLPAPPRSGSPVDPSRPEQDAQINNGISSGESGAPLDSTTVASPLGASSTQMDLSSEISIASTAAKRARDSLNDGEDLDSIPAKTRRRSDPSRPTTPRPSTPTSSSSVGPGSVSSRRLSLPAPQKSQLEEDSIVWEYVAAEPYEVHPTPTSPGNINALRSKTLLEESLETSLASRTTPIVETPSFASASPPTSISARQLSLNTTNLPSTVQPVVTAPTISPPSTVGRTTPSLKSVTEVSNQIRNVKDSATAGSPRPINPRLAKTITRISEVSPTEQERKKVAKGTKARAELGGAQIQSVRPAKLLATRLEVTQEVVSIDSNRRRRGRRTKRIAFSGIPSPSSFVGPITSQLKSISIKGASPSLKGATIDQSSSRSLLQLVKEPAKSLSIRGASQIQNSNKILPSQTLPAPTPPFSPPGNCTYTTISAPITEENAGDEFVEVGPVKYYLL